MLGFSIEARLKRDDGTPGLGRAGSITTSHGVIQTPAFIPVGTKATVKSLTPEQVRDAVGAQAVLANTYHLYLQPGTEVLEKAGGLHRFMNWNGPTFTDSGGFQAFSLQGVATGAGRKTKISRAPEAAPEIDRAESDSPALAKVDDDGVDFKSVIDGSAHRFTPEISMDIQNSIGADIIFAFDECAAPEAPYEYQRKALERTHAWAERCLARHETNAQARAARGMPPQALFGIVQGGRHEDLRRESARTIGKLSVAGREFDGFGIGGTFDKGDMATVVGWVSSELPEGKPRHLLGIGEPSDLILGIENGADTFDCVAPTRIARNGSAYVKPSAEAPNGRVNLLNARFATDMGPIDPSCGCSTCTTYSRAYISHLFRAKEMLAATLTSIHNLYYLVNLVKEARAAIVAGTWGEFKIKSGYLRATE